MESKVKHNNDRNDRNDHRFTQLINLIKHESVEEVKETVQKWSALLNLKDQSGRTALHYCSEHSSALCADLILEKCPNLLTTADNDGYTPLILSVICGNQVMTRYLISKSDANYVNECDFERHSAVHWATVCGQQECLHLLLSSGAHSSRADIHGAYPLHYSAQMCSPSSGICVGNDTRIGLTLLNRLLQCPDLEVDCVDSDGRTPLLWAASAGSADALLILINAGANISAKDKDGLTALHCASSRGHIDCVETLLTLGADINQMDSNGCPPLFYAVTLGHADCTRLLIESGADVNVQDFKGRTAAHCGAARGQFETIKILGQLGADLWLRNSRGDLPLHEAVKSGRKELVKWLLDQIPTAVNATNNYGRSPLHIAAINNNIEMCKILIDVGADVNTVMKLKGHFITPLDACLQKGYRSVAKYLLLHGALPASRVSNVGSKPSVQRCPSGRPMDTALDNNSPIETYEEWRAREENIDSALQSQTISHPNDNARTQLPKLPSIVKNNSDDQHILETSSSTPSSLLENGNHYKNVRQFETSLNNKPSNLKQAIITNVYVTNTPICHSKRVPPLKKTKKRRKTIQENDDLKALRVYTPSMSSSSSVINGEENVKVLMETKDDPTFRLGTSLNEDIEHSHRNGRDEITHNDLNNNVEKTSGKHLEEAKPNGEENANEIKSDNVTQWLQIEEKKKTMATTEDVIHNQTNEKLENQTKETTDRTIEETIESEGKEVKDEKLTNDIKTKSSESKTETNGGHKREESSSRKSVTSSKVNVKTASSEKSSDGLESKRNLSQRRTSVLSTKSVSNRMNSRERTLSKSKDSSEKAKKHSTERSSEVTDKEKHSKENNTRARKEFDDKMKKFRDKSNESTNAIKDKKKDSTEKTNGTKKTEEEVKEDSNANIKSDNESLNSGLSSTKEVISDKSESIQKGKKIKGKSNYDQLTTINGKVESKPDNDHDEYSDEWENDSELTVIDSQSIRQSIDGSESLERQRSLEDSGESKGKIIANIERSIQNEDKRHIKDKKSSSISRQSIDANQSKQSKKKIDYKTSNNGQNKTETHGKVLNNNKVVKSLDKKSEKKISDFNKTKKEIENKSTISRTKRSTDNKNIKTNEMKTSKVSKEKTKTNGKDLKLNDSLNNKSHLSVSDMSLNKTTEDKNERICSPLKNSVSNQDINQINYKEDRPITNLSSEESIFDSALVMADMDRSDSQMYSIDLHVKEGLFVSPLDQNQRDGMSPSRGQTDVCTELCKKSESRCGHKLHFKTMPTNLGKVDVTHIGSRVDSRRDHRYGDTVQRYSRGRVRRGPRVRPTSDGYTSVDPNFITQTVEKSLRKYQLERKLFEELHELKRFQIRSGKSNEILMVKRLVDRFRREVKAPGMTDFDGPFTYKTYEFYLYDQLRKLSWSNEGKVALLTRSASHENISQELIVPSNEYITQSNPELTQNTERLDINGLNNSRTQEINGIRITDETRELSQLSINENISQTENTFASDMYVKEVTEKKIIKELAVDVSTDAEKQQNEDDLGNERQMINHFDNESQTEVTNSDRLEQSVCETDRESGLTSDTTHYQKREQSDCNEDISHRNEPEFENLELKSQTIDSQNESTLRADEHKVIPSLGTQQNDGSVKKPVYSVVEKIEDITDSIINEALIEQKTIETHFVKQKSVQKTLSQTTLASTESKTDQLSDAKSTVGSLRSANFGKRSLDSGYSRKSSSKSIQSTNIPIIDKRKHKEKQIHRRECLKPISDIKPLESAVNRKRFKRLRTRIPAKNVMNIPVEDIRKRWKDIKETEMKKVFLFSEYKRQELTSGFILWYELNKNFKVRNKSIDCQIDKYIVENRKSLHRTLSDSFLNRHKFIEIK